MSEALALPAVPVERKSKIEEVFDPNFVELLRLVPRNPLVRALILKLTGKMPAPDCESFEQLKEWVEINCEKRARASSASKRIPEDGISISVDFSETEYGRADYSVRRSGSEDFRISAWDLVEMIHAAIGDGGGIDDIVEAVAAKIDGDAWDQCDPGMDHYGDYNYDDFEADDNGDSEIDYSKDEIRNAVLAFVRQRHPELAAEL
jgi:hypothetical protein